ncbi:MAG: hypothetical protein BGO69_10165 [Bacteroidetes bacterium 46-16]|mgnify:CR=1 FL=1|nr:MAG: hypothetical protein BGO69_10165 [Bacteroidetes bacterium 46-16]
MDKRLNTYSIFTRTERIGIALLLIILAIIISFRFAMQTIIPHTETQLQQAKLQQMWEVKKSSKAPAAMTDIVIDLNTADSVTLLSINGIGPKLAHRVLQRRSELGSFRSYKQIWALYHFSTDTKNEILKRTVLHQQQP